VRGGNSVSMDVGSKMFQEEYSLVIEKTVKHPQRLASGL
jgi:hypothetical protein